MDGRSKRQGKLYLLPAFDQVSGAAPLFHAWTDGQNYWYSILEKEVQYEHDLEIRWNTDKNCLGKNIKLRNKMEHCRIFKAATLGN